MFSRSSTLRCGLLLAVSTTLSACGSDDPLGRNTERTPVPVSNATTTAQLTKAALDHGLPSVVAISVTRHGQIRTGTGTVVRRGLVVADAALVGAPASQRTATPAATPRATARPTATATPRATATPTASAAARATTPRASTTPSADAARATTPTRAPKPASTSAPAATPRATAAIAAPATVIVRDGSGEEYPATIEGSDPVSGLAVLRVNGLTAAPAKPGAAPRLGQELAGVAYLSARREAVRPGTVVTTGRAARENRESEVGLIETTAALGAQSIGGPLVDARGQAVAVTTRAATAVVPGAVVGVPYASVLRIATALADSGRVHRAYLGVDTIAITPSRAEQLGLRTASGVLVQSLVPGSPAAFSTLRGPTGRRWIAGRLVPTGSDAITEIDGVKLREPEELDAQLATKRPGDRVALRVIRGTTGVTVHVTLGER